MPGQADKGNPNFFTLFKGRYNAVLSGTSSTSNVIMLTSTNVVQFLGDCTADDEGNLWVLPEECRPSSPVRLVCPIEPGGDTPGQSIEVVSGVSFETSEKDVLVSHSTTTVQLVSDCELSTNSAQFINALSVEKEKEAVPGAGINASNGLTANQYDTITSKNMLSDVAVSYENSSALTSATLSLETTDAIESIQTQSETIDVLTNPVISKTTIDIPGTSASKITILVVNPDGSVKGEPNKLHYTNGIMFSISDRWYL